MYAKTRATFPVMGRWERVSTTRGMRDGDTISETKSAPSAVWTLEIVDGGGGRSVTLIEGERSEVGSAAGAHLRVEDPLVSGKHCTVHVTGGRFVVTDTGSRNGIYTGGRARVPEARLDAAGCFIIGGTVLSASPFVDEVDDALEGERPLEGMVGESLAMRRLAREVRRLAPLRASVLVRGETGTGKELVAQALHRLGTRAHKPFLPLNMGALPGELADAELFGHERGAFTGATGARAGAFETARGGTLFLDEIAELALATQAKLLRALENGEIRPLGATMPRVVDVRVVAATWAPLDQRVDSGAFREDLYHRLAVLTINLPPLRARKSDIALLAPAMLLALEGEVGKRALHPSGLARLTQHSWPGNVRELRNVLLRAAIGARTGVLCADDVDRAIRAGRAATVVRATPTTRKAEARSALAAHDGNVSGAARDLGVARSTLRAWSRGT